VTADVRDETVERGEVGRRGTGAAYWCGGAAVRSVRRSDVDVHKRSSDLDIQRPHSQRVRHIPSHAAVSNNVTQPAEMLK